MHVRYLAAVSWNRAARARIAERMAGFAPLRLLFERGPLQLFTSSPALSLNPDGVLLGTVFSSTSTRTGPVRRELLEATGRLLIEEHFGAYLAFMISPQLEQLSVLRAPLGNLPCYWWHSGDLTLLGSDMTALMAAGMARPSPDPAALARHISNEDFGLSETCLSNICELQGGERLNIALHGVSREVVWSPWQFAGSRAAVSDAHSATGLVREAVRHAAAAQASQFSSVLLKLSGGLDSSVVAACLAAAKVPFTCLNLVTEHPAGDERQYARMVASHLDVPLVERFRKVEDVDLKHSAARRLPRPTGRAFTQASAANAREIAHETGAEAIFDGGGGDNVFCALQSPRPVADCLLRRDGWPSLVATACSIAEQAEVSLVAVAVRSLKFLLRRSRIYRPQPDTRFLSHEAAAEASAIASHPWLNPPAGVLPGKVAHVALVAAAQSVVEGTDVENDIPLCSPLISQPVVEACLRVPTWRWFGDGLNRRTARLAFAAELPVATIERRSKAGPDCFVADLYAANRETIRDQLLGGVLDGYGMLDRASIDAALADEAPVQGHDFLRIMHLVDAEAWARCWV